jgi:hypothetical protein
MAAKTDADGVGLIGLVLGWTRKLDPEFWSPEI